MNDDRHAGNPILFPELNRAAEAGWRLSGARTRFRKLAREAMNAFATADAALLTSEFFGERPAVYRGFAAAHTTYALFISDTMDVWETEDGIPEQNEPSLHDINDFPSRNRLDDILDGYLEIPGPEGFVEEVFTTCAREEFEHDRVTARRLLCIAATWGVDLRHCREENGWARRQGVFPGAEAAPSLACLLGRLSKHLENFNAPQAIALRMASEAVGRISAAANAYGAACCAEFEFASATEN